MYINYISIFYFSLVLIIALWICNTFLLRRYSLRYFSVKGLDLCKLLSNGLGEFTHTHTHTHTEGNVRKPNANKYRIWMKVYRKSLYSSYNFILNLKLFQNKVFKM